MWSYLFFLSFIPNNLLIGEKRSELFLIVYFILFGFTSMIPRKKLGEKEGTQERKN